MIIVISKVTGVESEYEIPDVLWERIMPLLPSHYRKKKVGRPRMDDGMAINECYFLYITYRLSMECSY